MDNNNLYGTENNHEAGSNANPYEPVPQQDGSVNHTYQQTYTTQPYNNQPYSGQPYGQQTYGQNYYTNIQEEPQKASGLAIASMVCGIISIVICCVWYLAAPLAIAAIVLGIVNNVKKLGGKGMAIAGIITGACGLLLVIALFVIVFAGIYSGELTEVMLNS